MEAISCCCRVVIILNLGLDFYTNTIQADKSRNFQHIKLHTLGPPEVAHICKLEKMSHHDVLVALKEAGMDSLPGAGAEILVDRVRRLISKGKCGADEWLAIMHEAHKLKYYHFRNHDVWSCGNHSGTF